VRRPNGRIDVRLLLIGSFFLLAWIGIAYRLYNVQGAQAAEFAQRGFDQRVRHEEIEPARGTIFDRDGVELAMTITGATVIANPSVIDQPVRTAELLAPVLDLNYVDLVKKFEGDGRFVYVARRFEPEMADSLAAVIEEHDLAGFTLVDEPVRIYPAGSLAAHTIGLTRTDDGKGIEGLELLYDDDLVGEPGALLVERDPSGRVIPQGQYTVEPAEPGSDIVLTLDREIQFIVEGALEEAVYRTGARGGAVVVLHAKTGEILALASAPTFNPAERGKLEPEIMRNRAITDTYEPGSTLKVIAIAGALEEGIVHPATPIETPRTIEVGEESYEDSSSNPPVMSVADVVTHSSNIGTIKIQQRLGDERHYSYLDAFGLGRPASIDFPGEASGLLPHVSEWCLPCGESAAIGYGISVTPLQMAAAYATIANDGEWVEPYLVAEIINGDGSREETEPRRRRALSVATAVTMRRLLQRVVDEGTGTRAQVAGFSVGGKTGTSNKFDVDLGRYSTIDTFASFVGIAPIDDPQIVVAIMLDSPHGELEDGADLKFGGASAAPVFATIVEPVLHQLGVAPDRVPG